MKKSKTMDKVLNVITIIIAIIVICVAVSTIVSSKKGYNAMFGVAGMNVLSDSMVGDQKDNFNKGDMIYIKILKSEDKAKLEKGEIITFWDNIDGKRALNTHRIEAVGKMDGQVYYYTKGDNNPAVDSQAVEISAVVGKYTGNKIPVLGSVVSFFQGKIGFMLFVVIPAFLVVVYAISRVVKDFRKVNNDNLQLAVASAKDLSEDEKEELKRKYLEQIKSENLSNNVCSNTTSKIILDDKIICAQGISSEDVTIIAVKDNSELSSTLTANVNLDDDKHTY